MRFHHLRRARAACFVHAPPTFSLRRISSSPVMMSTVAKQEEVAARTARLLAAKEKAGKSFDDLATEIGMTNTYTAQLLLGQAKLSAATASKLKAALPDLTDVDIAALVAHFPMRSWDSTILQEPNVYRTYEAVTHYGEAIKRLINEQCGDGIMSAIDFYCDVGTTTGKQGEKRVVITFNGKFLPFIEQVAADNGAPSPRD
uniref:Cyanate hydratase n=1 Tax=Coccolithus braarudii TaxID=221442 RepID=A0A7S0LE89_9EUKA|mmetsp:Transcript_35697/g.76209  ORF Transcript_35697/g.76209 Transcript_35697/m.76209 type:complete len:201 (+) Transcript_35697:12-614(+)